MLKRGRRSSVTAFECKASAAGLDPAGLAAFRRRHPSGRNVLVCLDSPQRTVRKFGGIEVEIIPYPQLGAWLDAP